MFRHFAREKFDSVWILL